MARNSATRGSRDTVPVDGPTVDATRSARPGAGFGAHGVMPARVVGASGAGIDAFRPDVGPAWAGSATPRPWPTISTVEEWHVHSTSSDGTRTIAENVETGATRGLTALRGWEAWPCRSARLRSAPKRSGRHAGARRHRLASTGVDLPAPAMAEAVGQALPADPGAYREVAVVRYLEEILVPISELGAVTAAAGPSAAGLT